MSGNMDRKAALDKLKKVSIGAEKGEKTREITQETPKIVEIGKPGDETSETDLEQPVVTRSKGPAEDVPAKFKRVITRDEMSFEKSNIAISQDVINEFNFLKPAISTKRMKAPVNSMMSNILREWLVKNADELQKSFGYKPYSHG